MREWQAYYEIEPFGEERADFRVAQLCALTINASPFRDKRAKLARPMDFMPFVEKPKPRRQTPQQQVDVWRRIFRSTSIPD